MSLMMPNGDTWDTRWITAAEQVPVYTNEDRTASSNGVSYVQNLTPQTSGRWYGELQVTYTGPAVDAYRVGLVGNTSPASRQFANRRLGEDPRSIAWTPLGNLTEGFLVANADGILVDGAWVSRADPYASGDTVSIAVDFAINRVWFRVNGGPWADERNVADQAHPADPATSVGGADFSTFGDDLKFIAVTLIANSSVTIGVLTYAPPDGFLPWLNPPPPIGAGQFAALPLPRATGTMFTGAYMASSTLPGAVLAAPTANAAIDQFNPSLVSFPIDLAGAQARVNIFDIPIVVHLVLTESLIGAPVRMNYPVNRTDFNLIRGVPNVIQFFVRDVDRHIAAGPLANAVLTLNIVDPHTQTLLLNQDLITLDAPNSLYALATQPTLPTEPVEMLNWPSGPLRYSVLVSRSDGTQSLLWTDRNYTPYGVCRLLDGPLPGPTPSVTLDPTNFVAQDGYFYSSALPGAAAKGYPDGLQTFVFYTTDFIGDVVLQASLVEQPSTEAQNWFDISVISFTSLGVTTIPLFPIVGPGMALVPVITSLSAVTAVNVTGNYLWLRVAIANNNPLPYPGLPILPPPTGTVDRILYRN